MIWPRSPVDPPAVSFLWHPRPQRPRRRPPTAARPARRLVPPRFRPVVCVQALQGRGRGHNLVQGDAPRLQPQARARGRGRGKGREGEREGGREGEGVEGRDACWRARCPLFPSLLGEAAPRFGLKPCLVGQGPIPAGKAGVSTRTACAPASQLALPSELGPSARARAPPRPPPPPNPPAAPRPNTSDPAALKASSDAFDAGVKFLKQYLA
jgi:hypothetical protein